MGWAGFGTTELGMLEQFEAIFSRLLCAGPWGLGGSDLSGLGAEVRRGSQRKKLRTGDGGLKKNQFLTEITAGDREVDAMTIH